MQIRRYASDYDTFIYPFSGCLSSGDKWCKIYSNWPKYRSKNVLINWIYATVTWNCKLKMSIWLNLWVELFVIVLSNIKFAWEIFTETIYFFLMSHKVFQSILGVFLSIFRVIQISETWHCFWSKVIWLLYNQHGSSSK